MSTWSDRRASWALTSATQTIYIVRLFRTELTSSHALDLCRCELVAYQWKSNPFAQLHLTFTNVHYYASSWLSNAFTLSVRITFTSRQWIPSVEIWLKNRDWKRLYKKIQNNRNCCMVPVSPTFLRPAQRYGDFKRSIRITIKWLNLKFKF